MSETLGPDTEDSVGCESESREYPERSVLTYDWETISRELTEKIGPHPDKKDYFDHICSEVLEAHADWTNDYFYGHDHEGKPIGMASELADIMILTMALAEICKIDLKAALEEKINYFMEKE